MRVFLSYAHEDRSLVEPVALALRAQGHRVFFDRDSLPPGEEYDIRIRQGIQKSQLFIFFVSPEALDAGSYTLTELGIAQKTWTHPAGRVLPVMLRPVQREQVPPYLLAVTVFEPAGNMPATVADEVHRLAGARRRQVAKAGVAALAVFGLAGASALWFMNRAPAQERIGRDGAPGVLVPAGNFPMGDDEEAPRREVYVDAFYMDRQEVTVARYAKFLAAAGSVKPPESWPEADPARNGDLPVIGVDWNDADAYCRWAGRRLPTEAQWEKAARGSDGRVYPWGNEAPTEARANFGKPTGNPYRGGLAPAGGRPEGASPFGVQDLAGNASEWVQDWFADGYRRGDLRNPQGPPTGEQRVIRGGGWYDAADRLKATRRMHAGPDLRADDMGFRCVQSLAASGP